jgi:hypothetical protein
LAPARERRLKEESASNGKTGSAGIDRFTQPSGNDIRQQLVLDGLDAVFQRQLALLQAFDLQLIADSRRLLGHDLRIQIAVLGSQPRQLLAELALVRSLHRPYGPPPGSRLHSRITIASDAQPQARLGLPCKPLLQNAKSAATIPRNSSTGVDRWLDKASLPCHTSTPFNTQTEGKMTLAGHLAELSEKHRVLEMKIQEELARPGADDLQISRLKKEKLRIKDEMAKLKDNSQH